MQKTIQLTLTRPPKAIKKEYLSEYYIIFWSGIFGALIHVVLLGLFFWQDIKVLAYFNILSIILWISTLYFNQQGKHITSIFIAGFEVIAHAIVATTTLGTDYGLQLFILPIACLFAVIPIKNIYLSFFLSTGCLIIFIGLYCFFPPRTDAVFLPDWVFTIFAFVVLSGGIPLFIGLIMMKLVFFDQRDKLEKIANIDALTGLYNRRFFYQFLDTQIIKAKQKQDTFCIALADIDNFKKINDEYGHDIGDDVLVNVAQLLTKNIQENKGICRWGGEEFIIFLPSCTKQEAYRLIDSLREKLYQNNIINTHPIRVSMSVGLIETDGHEDIDHFVKRADILLYKAKNAGRNNVQM